MLAGAKGCLFFLPSKPSPKRQESLEWKVISQGSKNNRELEPALLGPSLSAPGVVTPGQGAKADKDQRHETQPLSEAVGREQCRSLNKQHMHLADPACWLPTPAPQLCLPPSLQFLLKVPLPDLDP